MTKTPAALVIACLLAGPAIAQPNTPPTAPANRPPAQPLAMKLTVKVGADTRVHELAIFDDGCGHIEDKTTAYEDDISVCARSAGATVHIEASWKTRANQTEYRTKSATVMARKNSRFEVGRSGGTRFTLQLL